MASRRLLSAASSSSRRTMSTTPPTPTFTTSLLPSRSGNLGVIELNNPAALNALNLDMVRALNSVLPAWQSDVTLKATLFEGAHGKRPAFCAGGDVKSVYEAGTGVNVPEGSPDEVAAKQGQHGYGERGLLTGDFFREEYVMNHAVATQDHDTMPQISIWDGVVMGGGVGISIHGKYRVATENALFAMPETGIGLFPDVGGTWWLPRLKGGIGQYLALTGARLKANDLMYAGIATHYVSWQNLGRLKAGLIEATQQSEGGEGDCAAKVLMTYHEDAGPNESFLARHGEEIETAFGDRNRAVEDIVVALESMASSGSDFATETLATLRKVSPISLKVTHEGLRRGADLPGIAECLQMEYRMAQGFMREGSDFYEGVRAVLVDKDNDPKWNPKELESVTDEKVAAYFQNLDQNELRFARGANKCNIL